MSKTNASKEYLLAMNEELAAMSVADFQRWNPGFSKEEAERRIANAKTEVSKTLGPLFQEENELSPAAV